MRNTRGISLKKQCFRIERKLERIKAKLGDGDTKYFSDKERKRHQLFFNGNKFITQGEVAHGTYMFVRTLDNLIIVSSDGSLHHSYLANGKKVSSVGYFIFEYGKLKCVSNESGHYTPTNEEMLPDLLFYYELAKNPELIYEDHSSFPEKNKIYQYKIADILNVTSKEEDSNTCFQHLQPQEVIWDKQSNYGRQLKVGIENRYSSFCETKTPYTFFSYERNSNPVSSRVTTVSLGYQQDEEIMSSGYQRDEDIFSL
ncbi:hypothetical protein [Legionella brunensis]|uniref:Uncharacterized protein n=1 Tax=Legionella brunensis TaxID=29422 RepID=A0A0W0SVJ5_9GAMM|nr:hypothetical protein [Legionella brunensis]KTC86949.1 hypothetical protein Lbru_0178 [Legionella brunensis]